MFPPAGQAAAREMTAGTGGGQESRPVFFSALAFLMLAVAFSTVVHFTTEVAPEDDAFIIYRYVDNAVAGHGLVYNVGQRVFGASTPLYVAFLACVKSVARSVPTPDLAVRLNFIFYLAAGLGMVFLLSRLTRSAALAMALSACFMLRDDMLRVSTGGMESFLFAALALWSLWSLATSRWTTAAVLAGLSVMARPEGVLVGLVVFVAWFVACRRRPVPVMLGLAGPALVWVVFATVYYGTPIYHSLVAKSRPLYPLPFGSGLSRLVWELQSRVFGDLGARGRTGFWGGAGRIGLAAFIAVLGLAGCLRRTREGERLSDRTGVLAVPVTFGLFLLFYLATNPLIFEWYLPPVAALFFVFGAVGFSRLDHPMLRFPWSRVVFLVWAGFVGLRAPLTRVAQGRPLTDVGVGSDGERVRIFAYEAVARWLNENLPDSVTVLASEVGSLGYYYKGPILDACGLVSPEAIPFIPAPADERASPRDGVIPRALVRSLLPDVIVTMPVFAGRSLYSDEGFRETYVGVEQFPLPIPIWKSATVDVLIRRDRVAMDSTATDPNAISPADSIPR